VNFFLLDLLRYCTSQGPQALETVNPNPATILSTWICGTSVVCKT